jgi:hypothetical protein
VTSSVLAAGPLAAAAPPGPAAPLPAPLGRADALGRFRAPALVCLALLLAGYLRTAPGAAFAAPWGYRAWSFGALAYSDIIALHADRGGGRHGLPYLEDKIEYPVLLGVGMWLPSVLAPNRPGYFAITYLLLALCALGALWALCRIPGTAPWLFAASPALLVYAPLNWDLFGVLPLALGLCAWAARRERAAAALLALAACTKLFPILALWLLLACALRRGLRPALELAAIALGIALLVNLPFALGAAATRENWAWFFTYSRIREIEPSLYSLFGADHRRFVPAANAISSACVALAALALAAVELRTRRLAVPRALLLLLCVFFLGSKVYSPQYWIWVVLGLAFAGAPASLGVLAGAMALVDFVCSFAHLHLQMQRIGHITGWYQEHVFWPMVAARYAVLAACALWAALRLRFPPQARARV